MSSSFQTGAVQPGAAAITCWTPRAIGWTCFLIGFPSGLALAIINWFRMGKAEKAVMHLIGGAICSFALLLFLLLASSTVGRLVGLVLNLGALFYLHEQTKKDIAGYRDNGEVRNANGFVGFLIGLGVLAAYLAAAFVVAFVLVILGVPVSQ